MKIPLKIVPTILAAGWLSSTAALAGSFTTDFSTWANITSGGGVFLETNRAILTPPLATRSGGITVMDMDGGAAIESFTATFQMQLGPGSSLPADGVSFNFGPNIIDGSSYTEDGPGGAALTVEFDTYDNGGGEAPAIDIKFGANIADPRSGEIAHHPMAIADLVTSHLVNVSIQLDRSGAVTVSYNGQLIHDHVLVPGWAPTNGQFNISGRTGGSFAEQDIANLTINTVLAGAPVAASITADPLSATVNERDTTNFSFRVTGSAPFTYQWLKNDAPIPNATNTTLTLGPIPYTDNNATIKVQVTGPVNSVTSGAATLTVIRDTTPPTVTRVNANQSGTQLLVTYSEPVTDSALVPSAYGIDQGINVLSVSRVNASEVMLTTSLMPGGRMFTLTINNVQDTASSPPNTIAANTRVTFTSFLFQLGSVLRKKYFNFSDAIGYNPNDLFNDPRYPNFPDHQEIVPMWEYPQGGAYRNFAQEPDGAQYRNYCDSLEGFFIPAVSGNYVFITAGADNVYTFLSTDSDPANMHRICEVPGGWTNPRDWCLPQSPNNDHSNDGQTNHMRSDYFTSTTWPTLGPNGGALISLVAGQRYYMITVHFDHSWSGGDDFGVTFMMEGQGIPAAGTAPALNGNLVGTYLDPTGANVSFSQQPADVTIQQGHKATFTALATGSSAYGTNVVYQWQTAPSGSTTFTNIPGATLASYTTPVQSSLADSGRKYQVLATVPSLTVPSRVATMTVVADTTPPKLVAAGALHNSAGTFDVSIEFDETLDATSAVALGSYTLPGGTITAARYVSGPSASVVVLTATGLTVGNNYTVTVAGVADPFGNHMSPSSLSFAVSPMSWGAVGADELGLGSAVVPLGNNGFDVYSDGIGEWAAYDESTFVYEQITGDFDREVRVEYQDSSSQWARAGLIVRDVPNFGVNRATQQGSNSQNPPWDGVAGRYQKVHVNPVLTAMGTSGNNSYECNRRLDTGSQTTSAGGGGTPDYPTAWCRLQRAGQTFNQFRSDDGITWTQIGSTTWGPGGADTNQIAMPNTVYVGMEYSPENGNVATALRASFLTKYRNYRVHGVVPPPMLQSKQTASGLTLTFDARLQSADSPAGPWADVTGATSPYTVSTTGPQKFYRARW